MNSSWELGTSLVLDNFLSKEILGHEFSAEEWFHFSAFDDEAPNPREVKLNMSVRNQGPFECLE